MKHTWIPGLLICAALLSLGLALPSASYERTDLLSDGAVMTPHVNPNLVNPWGLAASPSGPFWIANEGTGTSSIVLADGALVAPDVLVPADQSAHPTGLVFNGGEGFAVEQGGVSGPSRFIFVTLEGRVLGWSPTVDPANAIVAVDNGASGASYTGAAFAENAEGGRLFVANFAAGSVEVFDAQFAAAGSFTDSNVPPTYSPFGVARIGARIYVTFVPRDPRTGDEVPGIGHGLIDVFSQDGTLIQRLATGGELNAPWGMVLAPGGFGPFSHKLLVGNFGDGRILGFTQQGHFFGAVKGDDGSPIVIEGLWGLLFGNGGQGGDPRDLYFTAGIDDEQHGVFGEIEFEP
jgi:uncharacterized protein (TIGR03118 family)